MTDILGPADANNSVTVRPVETRSFSNLDTFFRDCSTDGSEDGTEVQAAWLNDIADQLRSTWRMNGGLQAAPATKVVPEIGTNLHGMADAIRHAIQRGKTNVASDVGTANVVVVGLDPTPPEYAFGLIVRFIAAQPNTGPTTLNVNGLGPKSLEYVDGSPLVASELVAGREAIAFYNGGRFSLVNPWQVFAIRNRPRLTQATTFYVSTAGLDTNSGTSPGDAFLTPQRAVTEVLKFDFGGHLVTIKFANGTYNGAGVIVTSNPTGNPGYLNFEGNPADPSQVTIRNTQSSGNGSCFVAIGAAQISLNGFKITSDFGNGIYAQSSGSVVAFSNMIFDACIGGSHIAALAGGQVVIGGGSYRIQQNAQCHFNTQQGGSIYNNAGSQAVNIVGTLTFPSGFAIAGLVSSILANAMNFVISGSVSGPRYNISGCSAISTNGGGANFFPGNATGTINGVGSYA